MRPLWYACSTTICLWLVGCGRGDTATSSDDPPEEPVSTAQMDSSQPDSASAEVDLSADPPESAFGSPEAALNYHSQALEDKEWAEAVAVMTPEAQRTLLYLCVAFTRKKPEDTDKYNPFQIAPTQHQHEHALRLLDKYNLDPEQITPQTLPVEAFPDLKDPAPALVEFLAWSDGIKGLAISKPSQLDGVKFENGGEDRAVATFSNPPGMEKHFKNLDGRWYLHIDPFFEQ